MGDAAIGKLLPITSSPSLTKLTLLRYYLGEGGERIPERTSQTEREEEKGRHVPPPFLAIIPVVGAE